MTQDSWRFWTVRLAILMGLDSYSAIPYTSQNLCEQFDLESPSVPQFPVCKIIVPSSTSENIQCYVIIWIYLCKIHLEIEAAYNPNMVVLKIGIFKRSLIHKVSIPIDGICALIKGAQGSTEVLSAISIRWLFPEDAIRALIKYALTRNSVCRCLKFWFSTSRFVRNKS